jgi:hypothetical protein
VGEFPTWEINVNTGYDTPTTHAGTVYLKHLADELAEYTDGGLDLEVFEVVRLSVHDMIKAGKAEKEFVTPEYILPKPLIVTIKLTRSA